MAIMKATMQQRRGLEADFDAAKMKEGEFGIITDGKKVMIAFEDGTAEEIAMKRHIGNIDAVRYTEQELTTEQQKQARKNIGAPSAEDLNGFAKKATTLAGYGITDAATSEQVEKLSNEVAHYITPEQYGAVGDGVTDDSVAIQAAIDTAGGNKVVYLAKKKYAITTAININSRYIDFRSDGEIIYSGTDSAIILNGVDNVNIDVNIIRATNGNAIKFDATNYSVHQCNVHIRSVRSSKNCLNIHGTNANYSIYYNKIRIDEIVSSDTGVLIQADIADKVNENWFWLGRIYGGGAYGIKIIGGNANKFFTGDIEGLSDTATAIYLENGSGNIFSKFRCEEGYGEKSIVLKGVCSSNLFELSAVFLDEIDISGLESGSLENIIRSRHMANIMGGYRVGTEVKVSYREGITYDPSNANILLNLLSSTFVDNDIKMLSDNSIPTTINVGQESLDGKTFTLNRIFSEYLSMARGFPIVFLFAEEHGKILLKDNRNATILDNTNGDYAGKTVSVRWNGYDKQYEKHVWNVQILGEENATKGYVQEYAQPKGNYLTSYNETDPTVPDWAKKQTKPTYTASEVGALPNTTIIPTKTSDLTNDSGFLTQHQDISGKANKSDAETWTFTLSDGSIVTKKVVLAP